jgi:iron complex outermembrane receptor protein
VTVFVALATATLGVTGNISAQQASSSAKASDASGLEEIIVSARRRGEESLQSVPLAVSAFSDETLRDAGIVDLSQIAGRAPSFTFQEQIGNQQELVIRGIGTLRLTGSAAEPSVGTFIDEVYVGRRGTATPPIFDLERVEVVRGPQGTLYGKNVVGGAINLITAKPKREFGGRASVSYGQYDVYGGRDLWGYDAYITGPIGETTAGRIAIYGQGNDPYSENVLLNKGLDKNEAFAMRGSLLFEPSEALTASVSADFAKTKSTGQSRRAEDDPTIPGLGAVLTGGYLTDNPRDSESPWDQYENRQIVGLTGRVDYQFDNGNTLTYLASLRDGDFKGQFSLVGTTSPPSLTDAACGQHEEYSGLTQDLRLSSPAEGALRWIAGLYFLREDTDLVDNCFANTFLSFLGPGSVGDILDGELLYNQENVTRSWAVYGEAEYDLIDNLTLTVGGRFTWDDKSYRNKSDCLDYGAGVDFIFCVAPLGAETWDIRTGQEWNEFTPKVSLDWHVTDAAMLYASAAKGFKGGGWQGKPGTRAAALASYDPETAWTYEVGAKTQWAAGRVRANVALFYTDFKDLQVEQLDDTGLTLIIDNAASAEIKGVELELTVRPIEPIEFWLSGSYIDSEYKEFVDASGNDLSGNSLARTPKYMLNTGIEASTPIADALHLRGRVEYQWQDDMPWGVENTIYEDAYGLLNARLGVGSESGRWEVALYGKNLTDELYHVDAIPFLGDVFVRYAPPRSYGVQLVTTF